jgi:hypothetical protein
MRRRRLFVVLLLGLAKFALAQAPANSSQFTNHVLQFDGANGYVELPKDAFTNLTEATVEGWVKWNAFLQESRFFDIGIKGGWWHVRNNRSQPDLNMSTALGSRGERIIASGVLPLGEWIHIASTITTNSRRLYLNGKLVGDQSQNYTVNPAQFENRNYLGRSKGRLAFTNNLDFKGEMDEVRVWAGARSEVEIREGMFKKLTGKEPGLIALWNFDDPTQPGKDSSTNGFHGTFAGNAKTGAEELPKQVQPAKPEPSVSPLGLGNVLTLDGGGNYLDLPAAPFENLSEATLECWVKWHTFDRNEHVFEFDAAKRVKIGNDSGKPDLEFRPPSPKRMPNQNRLSPGRLNHPATCPLLNPKSASRQ